MMTQTINNAACVARTPIAYKTILRRISRFLAKAFEYQEINAYDIPADMAARMYL